MANTSIFAAFERMWHHVLVAIGNKADLDHSHNVSEIADLQEHLKDNSQMKLNIVLPAGRAKGDVNGDGIINAKDATLIAQHSVNLIELSGIELWAADIDGSGMASEHDASLVLQYSVGTFENITDFLVDYYGNWTWDKNKNYFYYDALVEDITSSHSAIVFVDKTIEGSPIVSAECMDGFIRVYAIGVPVTEINCSIMCSFADGKTIVVNSHDAITEINSRIDNMFVCLTQEEYDALKIAGQLNADTPYFIVVGDNE